MATINVKLRRRKASDTAGVVLPSSPAYDERLNKCRLTSHTARIIQGYIQDAVRATAKPRLDAHNAKVFAALTRYFDARMAIDLEEAGIRHDVPTAMHLTPVAWLRTSNFYRICVLDEAGAVREASWQARGDERLVGPQDYFYLKYLRFDVPEASLRECYKELSVLAIEEAALRARITELSTSLKDCVRGPRTVGAMLTAYPLVLPMLPADFLRELAQSVSTGGNVLAKSNAAMSEALASLATV